jgi:ABC-type multidrug transport system fused ATPase/permease subunit
LIPLAEFTLGHALLTVLEVFLFVAWIWILITVIGDLFSDSEVSGWGKAAWTFVLILLPFFGTFVYLIARGGGMAERQMNRAAAAQKQFDAYVRQAAASSPSNELETLVGLNSRGVLSDSQLAEAKQRLLAGDGKATA